MNIAFLDMLIRLMKTLLKNRFVSDEQIIDSAIATKSQKKSILLHYTNTLQIYDLLLI